MTTTNSDGAGRFRPLDWPSRRRVVDTFDLVFNDGPLNGCLALDHPIEEFAVDTIGLLWNENGCDFRLACAWKVPDGTIQSIRSDPSQSFVNSFFAQTHGSIVFIDKQGKYDCSDVSTGGFQGPASLWRPEHPPFLLVYEGSFDNILAAWEVEKGAIIDNATIVRLLLPYSPPREKSDA